jgi:D-alanyl-D-alanine carboxypeptidase (penicillin-binding protein 5/6)
MNWGFERFRTIRPSIERLEPIRIWKGSKKLVDVVPGDSPAFTAPRDRAERVSYDVIRFDGVEAPVVQGTALGAIVFSDELGVLKTVPLTAKESVALGSPLQRLIDTVLLFFHRLFNGQRA